MSDALDIGKTAGDVFNDRSRTLAPAAVASQVVTMSIISVVTILLFNLLRPNNKIIYEPKVKYHEGNKPPPRISSGLFGWLPPLIHTKEPELLEKIGLDAVTFLRFNRLLRQLFAGVVVLTGGILIPINVVYNLNNVDKNARDSLSMLTIRDVSGDWLYAHVVVTYLITIMIIVAVWFHWRAIIKLRHAWFRSPEYLQSFYARTIQITHVPKKAQSDDGLKDILGRLGMPYPTTSVHIGRRVGDLPDLIEYHNETVRQFEEVLVRYLKGGKLRAKRPTVRVGGFWGMGGKKLDAIDFYTAKLKRVEGEIEAMRTKIDLRKAENYGFASMAAVPFAHIVAFKMRNKHAKGTTISLAPNPKDIIWKNMNRTDGEIARRKTIGTLWLILVCFFNTIPLLIISFLANLDAIRKWVPFLEDWNKASAQTFSIVSGVLPATVSAIFSFFLPIIMRWLTRFMGALTYSRLDRAVIARYFAFLIISQLILFTLIGVIFSSVKEIILAIGDKSFQEIVANLDTLPDVIHRTYINQASYWLTYFPLRGFLVIFDLAQIINLLWLSFKTRVFGRTPRDIREWTQPPEFQYAVYYSNLLFMASVGLVFAPLAPLVAIAACIVFWLGSWIYKYQLMFVFVSKVESGGRLWNVVVNRLLFCVLLMQLLMILTIGLQKGFGTFIWVSAVPPILFMIAFKIYINRAFIPQFNYFQPTQEEIRLAQVHSSDNKSGKLSKRFGHPALHADLFTPMLQAELMPLLSQVYRGKIENDKAALNEYGGQNMSAQIMPSGIKIAAINESDLEYDPALYQRDRGELDWDRRSVSTVNMLDTASTLNGHYANASMSKINEYHNYGPQRSGFTSEIELTAMDSPSEHLLSPRAMAFQQSAGSESTHSLNQAPMDPSMQGERTYSPTPFSESQRTLVSPVPDATHQYPPQSNRQSSANLLAGQQPDPARSPSPYMQPYPPQHARQMSSNMLQGRASPGPQQAYGARAPSPGPYQALAGGRASPGPQQAMAGRMSPGPQQAYTGRSSPGPQQAYNGRSSPGSHQAYTGRSSPGPQQAYTGRSSPGPHQAYDGRSASPGPNAAYVGRASPAPQQAYARSPSPGVNQAYGHAPHPSEQWANHSHGRQASGNMLAMQHGRQQSGNMLQHSPLGVNVPPHGAALPHMRSPSGNPLASGHSPVSPAQGPPRGAMSPSPTHAPQNHAGRGVYRGAPP